MSLEDFFTLAELKHGLMAPARVEELVSVMQKESSCVIKNFPEVVRQWSAVASVLAATENKDSLDEFIKLNGVQFLNIWLQKALNCGDSTSDCSVEESIIALLGALGKLPIVQECSISSIIMASVKDLFGHKSFRVQDKARALFDTWTRGRETDTANSNVEKRWILCDKEAPTSAKVVEENGTPEKSSDETALLRENGNGDVHVQDSAGDEYAQSRILEASKPENIEDGKISRAENHDTSCETLIREDKDNRVQNSKENLSIDNESSIRSAEGTAPTEVLGVPVVAKEADPDSLTLVSIKEPAVLDHDDADKSSSSQRRISDSEVDVVASKVEHEMIDSNGPNYSENPVVHKARTIREGGDNYCNVLQDMAHDGDILRKTENHKSSSCKMEDTRDILRKAENPEASSCKMEDSCLVGVKPNEIQSDGAFPQKGEAQLCSKDSIQNSLATESAQLVSKSGKDVLNIDLNMEVYHEGGDCLNTSISRITASGTPDGYGTVFVEGSSYNSKRRQHLFEFDLNMTEGGLDGAADTLLTDQIPESSCLLSGESSIEVNSRREGRHNLDLNSVGDNDDSLSSYATVGKSSHHYLLNPTPAASSSSRQRLSTDIDLNKNLCFVNDKYDQQIHLGNLSSHSMNSCGELKRGNGGIFIMGKRVEINGNDSTPSQSILPNGQSEISFMGNSLPKQLGFVGLQQAVASIPQLYGCTVFPMGPSTSLSAVCEQGYIPYMVDSRGVHVAPQIVGSPIAFPQAYSQHPFPVSVNSTPLNVNGAGSTKPRFDLNSSSMMVEGLTGELGGWTSGQNHLEESMGSTSQCLNSGLGMKRKEPDGGLELFPYSHKQQ